MNIPEKNQYLLFSGVSLKRYSDVFIFDMNTKKWTKENCTGAQPKDLCYAYGWYDKPNFFFYGGKNKELSLSDVFFLDTNKWVWKKVITIEYMSMGEYMSEEQVNYYPICTYMIIVIKYFI